MTQLIDERENLLIVFDGDNPIPKTITKDDYNCLKYKQFGGNRIFYDFDKKNKVAETFDNRIFNCTYNGRTIQIRDGNKIAKCITAHKKTGKLVVFIKSFKEEYYEANKREIVSSLIKQFGGRVKESKDGYIVDEIFMVDLNGTSYFKSSTGWSNLCTVAQGNLRNFTVETDIGTLDIDSQTIVILAKLFFLMNPKLDDHVFFDQLPTNLQKFLKENEKGMKRKGK